MKINFDSIIPVYLQIAQAIEDDILMDKLKEGDNCYSQLVISKEIGVNPATAAKGIYLLVQKGVLDKQRGLSMVVAKGAKDLILNDKIKNNLSRLIEGLINEADKLNFSKAELFKLIETHYTERGEKNE
ncbi:MAG: GntR family transcriptional regulator [Oscillospiraceae bacterium]|nr:GntR family transcriptional regulator [Oscillospiraceae bacterium]